MAYAIKHQGQVTTASGLDVLVGIWLVISPFVLLFKINQVALTDDIVFGCIIGVLAAYRFTNPAKGVWVSWINLVLGVWVLISPWLLGLANLNGTAMSHRIIANNVISGCIVILLSAWSALAAISSPDRFSDTANDDSLADPNNRM